MFKWMINGHRGSKNKGSKLNNWNNNNNGAKRNLNNEGKGKPLGESRNENPEGVPNNSSDLLGITEAPNPSLQLTSLEQASQLQEQSLQEQSNSLQQSEQQHRFAQFQQQQRNYRNSQSNLLGASRDTLDDSNEYTTLEQLHLQPGHLDLNNIQRVKSVEQLSGNKSLPPLMHSGLNGSRNDPPFPPSSDSRPPNSLAIGSQPNLNHYSSHHDSLQLDMFSNPLPEAPGTCTLPRRSAIKEDINARYRSPSNPPNQNRFVPPPYSRHQFPENSSTVRRVYQPPPPPPPRIVHEPPPPPRIVHDATSVSPYKHIPQNSPAANPPMLHPNLTPTSAEKQETNYHQWKLKIPVESFNSVEQYTNELTELSRNQDLRKESHPHESLNQPSKSTEDLLHASRVPNCNVISSNQGAQSGTKYDVYQTDNRKILRMRENDNNKTTTEVLSSDSVYPSDLPTKGRYESIVLTSPSIQNEQSTNFGTSQDQRRKILVHPPSKVDVPNSKSSQMDFSPNMPWDRLQRKYEGGYSDNHSENVPKVDSRLAPSRDQYQNEFYLRDRCKDGQKRDRHDLFIHEDDDRRGTKPTGSAPHETRIITRTNLHSAPQEKSRDFRHSHYGTEKETPRGTTTFTGAVGRGTKEGYSVDGADKLIVKDAPTYPSLDRSDWNQKLRELEMNSKKKEDAIESAITTPSSSWMEWTQQLKAYVAWVNSQLRKRPDQPLVSDLRRDFQNGVVFADLIEIISGERIPGIVRDADTPQLCRENLDRILQFMSAKRIRMTHITSKEIAEGNLKSIMRVILALAAHYKPQSVRDGSYSQEQQGVNQHLSLGQNSLPRSSPKKTHDVGVGPDKPLAPGKTLAPDKTPSLIRKNIAAPDDEEEENEEYLPLRRQPSLTNTTRPSSPSPVYENLIPKRAANSRWAYDSLRASHKFYWGSSSPSSTRRQRDRKVASSTPQKGTLDDTDVMLNSTMNTQSSQCTSLNTSMDGDVNALHSSENFCSTSFTQKVNKPAALDFWQGLQGHDSEETKKTPEVEADNPFRYHTVHRMSGRRKLPQIPGQSSPSSNNSRGTTPLGINSGPASDISQSVFEDTFDRSRDASVGSIPVVGRRAENGGSTSDETSREPEGRSQNSSPDTSVTRDPIADGWRQVFGQEPSSTGYRDAHLKQESDETSKIFTNDEEALVLRQEVIKHVLNKKALENEKVELSRHIHQKENQIAELRKQLMHKEKTLHLQKIQFDETIRNIQNVKSYRPLSGESSTFRCQGREELQLVREAINALRANFRGTDPNQHTLDTLEQAISVLMERGMTSSNVTDLVSKTDSRCINGSAVDMFTKVIYFTDRTVTPFMSSINKRIGDVTLGDFKEIFDRPGSYRFHFKSQDPEYGLVKEEIINDDDILPGIDGKIIAWVQEDLE